jgi:hypothetical protein
MRWTVCETFVGTVYQMSHRGPSMLHPLGGIDASEAANWRFFADLKVVAIIGRTNITY